MRRVSSGDRDPGLIQGRAFMSGTNTGSFKPTSTPTQSWLKRPDKEVWGLSASGVVGTVCTGQEFALLNGFCDLQKGKQYPTSTGPSGLLPVRLMLFLNWLSPMALFPSPSPHVSSLIPKLHLPAQIEYCNRTQLYNLTPGDGKAPERGELLDRRRDCALQGAEKRELALKDYAEDIPEHIISEWKTAVEPWESNPVTTTTLTSLQRTLEDQEKLHIAVSNLSLHPTSKQLVTLAERLNQLPCRIASWIEVQRLLCTGSRTNRHHNSMRPFPAANCTPTSAEARNIRLYLPSSLPLSRSPEELVAYEARLREGQAYDESESIRHNLRPCTYLCRRRDVQARRVKQSTRANVVMKCAQDGADHATTKHRSMSLIEVKEQAADELEKDAQMQPEGVVEWFALKRLG
ncbi:hypothetical protein NMY22_g4496 [Coprinellus aureogranulatus]|nr:hypothetical protein NMY22_g4496 [Coprinellus aureogranulatus]